MTPRQIATNQAALQCDVCGRTLLRGEQPAVFLAGGSRRNVCELCTPRAAHEGWIREGVAVEELGVRQRGREGRGSLFSRFRTRRDGHPRASAAVETLEEARADEAPYVEDVAPPPPPPPPAAVREAPREPRHVHAVPTNADMKRARAVDVFNGSNRPRT